jgi:TRAP-type C4-dicarboxylate transport system permease small subunit
VTARPDPDRAPAMSPLDAAARRLAWVVLRLLDAVVGILVTALLAIVVSELVDRNFVDLGLFSPEEYVKVLLVWLCFIGVARAFAGGDAIRVTFVAELLPRPVRIAVSVLCNLLILGVLSVMIWKAYQSIPQALQQMILGTDLTVAVPTLGMLIGLALLVPVFLVALVRNLRGHDDTTSTGAAGIE